jgi:hypothetical protein
MGAAPRRTPLHKCLPNFVSGKVNYGPKYHAALEIVVRVEPATVCWSIAVD